METKKYIFELTTEQHEALLSYANVNNMTKTDVIRLFCDSLKDMDFWRTNIIVHDDKRIKGINPWNDGLKLLSSTKGDVDRIDININYEQGKPFTSNYVISKKDIINFGGTNNV